MEKIKILKIMNMKTSWKIKYKNLKIIIKNITKSLLRVYKEGILMVILIQIL